MLCEPLIITNVSLQRLMFFMEAEVLALYVQVLWTKQASPTPQPQEQFSCG